MALEERILSDMKSAMKSGEKERTKTLRGVYSQIKDERIKLRPKRELTEEDVINVLISAAKRRRESILLFRQGNRNDLVESEQAELNIIQEYLPEQLSEDEIVSIINNIIQQMQATSINDLGKVMGPAMGQLKGKADGKLVQNVVRQRLTALSQ